MDCRRRDVSELFRPLSVSETAGGKIFFGVEIPNTQAARSLAQSIMTLGGDAENYCDDGTADVEETRQPYLQAKVIPMAYVGEIRAFFSLVLPEGWLEMDGSTYNQVDYPELYDAISPNLKGGGVFVLPSMFDNYLSAGPNADLSVGQVAGSNDRTLSVANLPPHSHSYNVLSIIPGPALQAGAGATYVGQPLTTGSTGSGTAFDVRSRRVYAKWACYAGAG